MNYGALSQDVIGCNWKAFCAQLISQWKRLSASDLETIGPNRRGIARLIAQHYGLAAEPVESYLRSFERYETAMGEQFSPASHG